MTFNPRYGALGLVALPQVWLFQIALALVSPLVDLALIVQIVRTLTDYLQHGEQFNSENMLITASYYAAFVAVDLTAAGIAFLLETEGKALAPVVACSAALRLPADHVLCGGEIGAQGGAGPPCRMGQARTQGDRHDRRALEYERLTWKRLSRICRRKCEKRTAAPSTRRSVRANIPRFASDLASFPPKSV